MKKRIIILLILITFIGFIPNISGYNVNQAFTGRIRVTDGIKEENIYVFVRDGQYAFCAERGSRGPTTCDGAKNHTFSTDPEEDTAIKVGLAEALRWHQARATDCVREAGICDADGVKKGTYPRYVYSQLAIHKFLSKHVNGATSPAVDLNKKLTFTRYYYGKPDTRNPQTEVSDPKNYPITETIYNKALEELLNVMESSYNTYKTASLSLSSPSISFHVEGNYYVSNTITVNRKNIDHYDYNLKINNKDANGRISRDGEKFTIKIPQDAPELNGATKMNVTLTVTASRDYAYANVRNCKDGSLSAQPIIEEYHGIKTKKYSASASGELVIDECRLKFVNDKQARIELYESLKSQGKDYRNLLDFNKTNVDVVCDKANQVKCNYNNNSSCLSSTLGNTTFDGNNLSCYNNTISKDNQNYYCLTRFEFKNNMSEYKTNFVGPTGQAIKELSVNPIGNGKLITTCYNFSGANSKIFIKYSDYIGDIKFNNESLVYNTNKANELVELKKNGNNYTSEISMDYSFKPIYVKNGTGEKVESNCSECKVLNNGFLTTFMYDIDKVVLPFSITFNNKAFSNIEVKEEKDGACTYTPEYELVKENELELEFREIKINSPFPGKEGDTRRVGSNWCERDASGKIISCSGSSDKNSLVNSMVERNDSYNKNGEEPKYKIVLTPDDIQAIKNYNLETQYDDYTLYCEGEGNECHSRFVDGLKTGTLEYYNTQTGKVENAFKIRNKLIVR